MSQPIRKNIPTTKTVKKNTVKKKKEYGTSKLEKRFATDFLDKLGVKYIYQFKAESIGRYYDYYLPEEHLLIEVDGDYYHSKDIVYENMSPMQKHNRRVDKQKDHWALINGIPILRIWESDINKNPEKVFKILKDRLYLASKNKKIIDNKKKRNFNKNVH